MDLQSVHQRHLREIRHAVDTTSPKSLVCPPAAFKRQHRSERSPPRCASAASSRLALRFASEMPLNISETTVQPPFGSWKSTPHAPSEYITNRSAASTPSSMDIDPSSSKRRMRPASAGPSRGKSPTGRRPLLILKDEELLESSAADPKTRSTEGLPGGSEDSHKLVQSVDSSGRRRERFRMSETDESIFGSFVSLLSRLSTGMKRELVNDALQEAEVVRLFESYAGEGSGDGPPSATGREASSAGGSAIPFKM